MIELDVLSAAQRAADEEARATLGQPQPWRSRAAREGTLDPAVSRDEFLPGAPVGAEDAGTSRRSFLKVMGASVALAGLTGCRRPIETIVPYARKPEEVIPGVPQFYATAMPLGGVGHPLLVQSHEGRPTKVEGNPEHPVTLGASDMFAQASVLQLYDPDRSRHVWHRTAAGGARADWGTFVGEANRLLARRGAANVAVLAAPTSSPTQLALRDRFLATYPNARWITLGPHLEDFEALGTQQAFGQPARPLYRFSEANVIVSFDADFVSPEFPNSVWNSREYAASRRVDERGSMSRLYAIESTMTITGGAADHRRAMKAGAIPFVAAAIADGLGVGTGVSTQITDASLLPFIAAIVDDVRAAGGRAAFVAGRTQPAEVHALVAALNGRYGGQVVSYLDTEEGPVTPVGPQLVDLVRDMNAGAVDAVLMLETNPVYALPAELNFAEALLRVPTSIHVGLYRDETGQLATWHVPAAHYLESWGDLRAYDGTLSIVQPLIAPLYDDARSDIEVLNTLVTGRNNAGYDLLRQSIRGRLTGDFETAWRTALHDGFVPDTGYGTVGAAGGGVNLSGLRAPEADDIELVFRLSPTVYDGQFANVAWMQEAPHPVTKLTWDPAALVSPATAIRLGLEEEVERFEELDGSEYNGANIDGGKHYSPVIRIKTADGAAADLPVWVQPGHPDNSITVLLGYGRDIATDRVFEEAGIFERINRALRPGRANPDVYEDTTISALAGADLAEGPVAARVERLRSFASGGYVPAVGVERTGVDDYLLASTQDHGSLMGRNHVRMATLEEYLAVPEVIRNQEHLIEETPWEDFPPLWGPDNSAAEDPRIGDWQYSENQWGMTIDLNACTGCQACVVACQAENNVPVVGKDQVSRGREMHWLRLDRYYVGDEADPGMVTQPMLCVHCEFAPCEQVCPVNATSHSPDGINEMTYNRCIGTRYCANNCPYKVRRYNFYNWTKDMPLEVQMAMNPYVTVRYRGVMEKCTFCVQRVRHNQQYAHIENRPLRDGDVQTACQQACPSQAIVFGDLKDATSAVSRSKQNLRNYGVLAELNTNPRVTYLARLRNPHPSLAGTTPYDGHGDGHGTEHAA